MPTLTLNASQKVLVVLGDAPNLLEDLALLQGEFTSLAINRAALRYNSPLTYWASCHPANFLQWVPQRKMLAYPDVSTLVTPYPCELSGLCCKDVVVNAVVGSSSLYGIFAGIKLGFKKIITAGVVLDDKNYTRFQKSWLMCIDDIKDTVRGLSGFPMRTLGFPSSAWVNNS